MRDVLRSMTNDELRLMAKEIAVLLVKKNKKAKKAFLKQARLLATTYGIDPQEVVLMDQ